MDFRLVAALVLLFGGAPELAAKAIPATPLGNPGDWVTTPDYPADALRDDVQGTVGFRLDIDAGGVVSGCVVTQSSGSVLLDDTACRLITERARFAPATNAKGKAAAGTYTNRVRWVLPSEVPQPRYTDVIASFIVEADGTFSNCQIEQSTGLPVEVVDQSNRLCTGNQHTEPFRDAQGRPVRRRVRTQMKATIEPVS